MDMHRDIGKRLNICPSLCHLKDVNNYLHYIYSGHYNNSKLSLKYDISLHINIEGPW
jgi:hypothetical protein